MSAWANRILDAAQTSTRWDRTEVIYADDRETFDLLVEVLEGLAEDTSAEHSRDGDTVREGWGTDPDNVDMTWRVELVLDGGAS